MKKLLKRIQRRIDDLNLSKKLVLLYILCVILPLAVTDGAIFLMLNMQEKHETQAEISSICSAVESDLRYSFDEVASVTNSLYTNSKVHEFLTMNYGTGLSYFIAWHNFTENVPIELLRRSTIENVSFYADNRTLVDGGNVFKINEGGLKNWMTLVGIEDTDVYNLPNSSFYFYYVGDTEPTAQIKRRISYVRQLNFFKDSPIKQFVRVDADYNTLVEKLDNMKIAYPVIICSDDRILYSNMAYTNNNTQDFLRLSGNEDVIQEKTFTSYGQEIRILILSKNEDWKATIATRTPWILVLVLINLVLPIILGKLMHSSFVNRLRALTVTFDSASVDNLPEVTDVTGKDEIGLLAENYNYMARRINELIRTIYTDRLEKQEMDIERQNAELLALESQINPHFLFNALESIRMHCLLSGETDTAKMISRLAVLERQSVNWDSDYIKIYSELEFIEAYLELQRYRFGERFHFEIDVPKEVGEFVIPKLTIVTFVENSCVHGIENKATDCWIYVRAYEKGENVVIEIEDTGTGMDEERIQWMANLMDNCTIDDLKTNHHVGVVNACLRLHMMTKHEVRFEIDSELGVGTFFTIFIPKKYATDVDLLKKQRN